MDYTAVSHEEQENKKKGAIASTLIHIGILILAILPLLTFPDPPPGQAGVLVAFGDIESGVNEEPAGPTDVEETEEIETDPVEAEDPKPEPPKEEPTKPEKKKEPETPKKDVLTDKNSKELELKKKKEKEAQKKIEEQKKKERDAKRKADAEAKRKADEAKKKAAAEAKKKADEEARKKAEAEKWKNIGAQAGSGGGKGDGGKPGDQGKNDGDPDGSALDGISTGSGDIGGGLKGRKVTQRPKITDNSQKVGDVMVKVCVNASGKVISAKYTQGGSTTTDPGLISKAISGAKGYKFEVGDIDEQCGTIKIKFRF